MSVRSAEDGGQGRFDLPWLSLTLAGLIAALGLLGGAPSGLIFESGHWLGLLTSHVVHVDAAHLLWNLAPLCLFGACAEACRLPDRRTMATGLLLACGLIDVWLLLDPQAPDRYCGLSGPLHAVFAMALLALHRELGSLLPLAVLALGAAKVAVEWFAGAGLTPSLAASDWSGTPEAHALGLVAGVLAWQYGIRHRGGMALGH